MKPKTKLQKQVVVLSKRLPKLTEIQKIYAFRHCFEHIGRRTAKGIISCTECGHQWQGGGALIDTVCDCTCPQCGMELNIQTTRKRVFKENEYFSIITTCNEFQVIRFFFAKAHYISGQPADYSITEVTQRWIAPDGKFETIARLRGMSFIYYDLWQEGSTMEIRKNHRVYDIEPACIYPRMRTTTQLKRNGFTGDFQNIAPFELFRSLLTDNRAETLIKTEQYSLLRYFIRYNTKHIDTYWNSLRICIRNAYTVEDGAMWCDYIDLLRFFGKDLNSAKYVCPANLKAEHDRMTAKKRVRQERERLEEKKRKAMEDEQRFQELKQRFFGIILTDGEIQIKVLESVSDFVEESQILHHCLFQCNYHLLPDSLIFSACIGEKHIETVEFSLQTQQVVQSRGAYNKTTEFHDRIINLVNKNKRLIRKRMAA